MKKFLTYFTVVLFILSFTPSLEAQERVTTVLRDTITICAGQNAYLFGPIREFTTECTPFPPGCSQSNFVVPPPTYYWEGNGIPIDISREFPEATVSPTVTTLYTQGVRYSCPRSSNCATGVIGGTLKFKETLVIVDNNCIIRDTLTICAGQTAFLFGAVSPVIQNCPSLGPGCLPSGLIIPSPSYRWEGGGELIVVNANYPVTTVSPTITTLYSQSYIYSCPGSRNCAQGISGGSKTFKQTLVVVVNCSDANTVKKDTIKICSGQSANLTGITSFYPDCPIGFGGVSTDMIPTYYWEAPDNLILPNSNQTANVSPSTSTIYKHIVSYNCLGGPGSSGSIRGPFSLPLYKTLKETFVSVENCQAFCSTEGTFFFQQCANEGEFFFIKLNDGRVFDPFFANGLNWEVKNGQKVKFSYIDTSFVTPCPQAEKAITINCVEEIEPPVINQNCSTEGTFFFEQCANEGEFFFIKLNDGRIFDPYFDNGINWTVKNGQKVRFNYRDTSFVTPCSQAAKAITITCVEEIIPKAQPPIDPLLNKYPWLLTTVDTRNCDGTKISEYDFGGYSFILVESPTQSIIYYETGSLHCTSSPQFDCRPFYGIANKQAALTYTCSNIINGKDSQKELALKAPKTQAVLKNKDITQVVVSPNPVEDNLIVDISGAKAAGQLTVYDIYGRSLLSRSVEKPDTDHNFLNLDLTNYHSGIYMVEWRSRGFSIVKKVIKQ
jgi:hypothetical protein